MNSIVSDSNFDIETNVWNKFNKKHSFLSSYQSIFLSLLYIQTDYFGEDNAFQTTSTVHSEWANKQQNVVSLGGSTTTLPRRGFWEECQQARTHQTPCMILFS